LERRIARCGFEPFTFRSYRLRPARTRRFAPVASPQQNGPKIVLRVRLAPRLVIAERTVLRHGGGRSRESLVLREHVARTSARTLRLEQRVESRVATFESRQTHAPSARPPQPAQAVRAPGPLVFRVDSREAEDAREAGTGPTPRAERVEQPPPGLPDVAPVADEVLRILDRRIVAERERRGRV
jgi:hypothetical protein